VGPDRSRFVAQGNRWDHQNLTYHVDDYPGELAKEDTFTFRQQLITPVECGSQGTMSGQRRSSSAGQEDETIIQTTGNLLKAQSGRTCSCKLYGQGNSIEMPANTRNHRDLFPGHVKIRLQRLGSSDE